jgi:hypothetical protein
MTHSTLPSFVLTSALDALPAELAQLLRQHLQLLAQCVAAFRRQPPTPPTTCQFENDLAQCLRALGRDLVQWAFNHLETDDADALPTQVIWQHEAYQRRPKSPKRHCDCLFGPIRLYRYRFDPVDGGEHSLFPLEMALGLEAQRATPALAERVGRAAAALPQASVREQLARDQDVRWSVPTLRKVTANLSEGMAEHREAAQAAKLVEALRQAAQSAGPHEPTLVTGRDGVMVPLRGQEHHGEASAATVSVLDRQGHRLYTAYLGRMPEKLQATLSRQLTSLLVLVLSLWRGQLPRLLYVTDGGWHPTIYFRQVLRRMKHPLTGARLCWERVIDFFHACEYISQLAEALYGRSKRRRYGWAAKMRRWLRYQAGGIQRLLYSAGAVHARRQLSASAEEDYQEARQYLHKRKRWMKYAEYKRQGLVIGSGVTEAACKTVFTQRLKQSGMRWQVEGGQVVVDLRIVLLSRVWEETHRAYLKSKPQMEIGTLWTSSAGSARKAA